MSGEFGPPGYRENPINEILKSEEKIAKKIDELCSRKKGVFVGILFAMSDTIFIPGTAIASSISELRGKGQINTPYGRYAAEIERRVFELESLIQAYKNSLQQIDGERREERLTGLKKSLATVNKKAVPIFEKIWNGQSVE